MDFRISGFYPSGNPCEGIHVGTHSTCPDDDATVNPEWGFLVLLSCCEVVVKYLSRSVCIWENV